MHQPNQIYEIARKTTPEMDIGNNEPEFSKVPGLRLFPLHFKASQTINSFFSIVHTAQEKNNKIIK